MHIINYSGKSLLKLEMQRRKSRRMHGNSDIRSSICLKLNNNKANKMKNQSEKLLTVLKEKRSVRARVRLCL